MDEIEELFDRAVKQMVEKNYKEARRLYREVVKKDPSAAGAWHNLGIMEGIFEDYERAIQALRNALAIKPDRLDSWYVLGMAYDKKGDLPLAIQTFKMIVDQDPMHVDAWCSLGSSLLTHGDYKSAIDAYETCLKKNPGAIGVEETLREVSEARDNEITRLTKAKNLFIKARGAIKKRDMEKVARLLEKDIETGTFRNDADISALNKEQLDLIRDRLREVH